MVRPAQIGDDLARGDPHATNNADLGCVLVGGQRTPELVETSHGKADFWAREVGRILAPPVASVYWDGDALTGGTTMTRIARTSQVLLVVLVGMTAVTASAQVPLPNPQAPLPAPQGAPLPTPPPPLPPTAPPPVYPPTELDRIVSPIALYPDPLLAQVLAGATYAAEIPGAAQWADEHRADMGQPLTVAMTAQPLPWDPPVQALLPFPSVLDMMASAMPWTEELGAAFLAQPQDVMAAVQRMRQLASGYGYLRSTPQVQVTTGPYIEIVPVNPSFVVVPYYNPVVVFAPPRPGVTVFAGINFGFGVTLGPVFAPWGWGATRVVWASRTVIINNAPWQRTWVNRTTYVHPYAVRVGGAAPRFAGPDPLAFRHAQERYQLDSRHGAERGELDARHQQELQAARSAEQRQQVQARQAQEQRALDQRHQQERASVQQRQAEERRKR